MDALQDEVESLEAILMDDVRITRNTQSGVAEIIETTVYPVMGEDEEQQYVCVTLQVLPTSAYPDTSPNYKLLRPRGLDDSRLEAIKTACNLKLQESLGFPVVFDLIEVVREHLTGSNLPSGQCVVCLYGFSDGDEFTRTECFHYLHSYCLSRHLNAARRNYQEEYDKLPAWLQKTAAAFLASCPVCRERIKDESDSLKCAMPPAELQNAPDFKLTRELRELQQRMSNLFLQQKSRGAIIDVEAESGTVISIETEEEVRRRLQRKHDEAATTTTTAINNLSLVGVCNGIRKDDGEVAENDIACSKSSSSAAAAGNNTNFSPVVQPTQRISNENNNYQHQQQHNRRHYRGGRRHQNHHFHHRDRDREARYEQHNNTSHNNSSAAGGAATTAANASSSNNAGKQSKAQAATAAHTR